MKMIPMIAAVAATAAFPAVAIAQSPRSVTVAYADLDLSSPTGIAMLESRIEGAARRVCGQRSSPGVAEWNDHRNCLRDTRAAARTQAQVVIARTNGGQLLAAR